MTKISRKVLNSNKFNHRLRCIILHVTLAENPSPQKLCQGTVVNPTYHNYLIFVFWILNLNYDYHLSLKFYYSL